MERDGNDSVMLERNSRRERWRSRSPILDPLSTFWRSPVISNHDSPQQIKVFSFDYFEPDSHLLEKCEKPEQHEEVSNAKHFPITFDTKEVYKISNKPATLKLELPRKKDSMVSEIEVTGTRTGQVRGLKKQIHKVQNFWKKSNPHQPNVFQKIQFVSNKTSQVEEDQFEDSIHRFTGDTMSNGNLSSSDDMVCIIMTEDFSNKLICNSERIEDIWI